MAKTENIRSIQTQISLSDVGKRIFTLRGRQVMLDSDLGEIYEVETKYLKRSVKRNLERFPEDFMFEPNDSELQLLRSQFGTSSLESETNAHGGTRYKPMAFTELGIAMLSSVLHSQRAIQLNIEIMRVFVQLRKEQRGLQSDLLPKLESLEKMFGQRFDRL